MRDVNTQIREALYLVSATDVAEDPFRLIQVLLPRLEELVKCKAFTLKSAGMVVNGSIWAARKAAAEAFEGLATVKAVRQVMNQMMEAWKQVPDLSEVVSIFEHLMFPTFVSLLPLNFLECLNIKAKLNIYAPLPRESQISARSDWSLGDAQSCAM
ncbi:hypothetical protein Bca52824_001922 [Brassica carinata]|uniref:Uncharacterized protein n=1 Tax=Brassica carinata TaxID=52824 RepID=A0A8X8BDI2_BRACI|nr:hypothetical protein Bca52824_001922 [Brassica carinata]